MKEEKEEKEGLVVKENLKEDWREEKRGGVMVLEKEGRCWLW